MDEGLDSGRGLGPLHTITSVGYSMLNDEVYILVSVVWFMTV